MKFLVLCASILGLLMLSPVASADNRHGRGYDRHYDFGYYGRNRYRNHWNSRNYYPARYDRYYRPYGYGGSYWSFSVGSGRRHSHIDGGALLGGIVLGSVLGHSVASSRYEREYVTEPSRVRVISRTPVTTRSAAPQRRLLRDLEGRCYEIDRDGAGNETRIELDPSACSF